MKKLLELTKTGAYVNGDRAVTVTKEILAQADETFVGSVPLAIGHAQDERLPKIGEVLQVSLKDGGNTLAGIVDFNKIGDALFGEGLYDQWSVALKKNAEGKYYLHHVAFLGEVPPAVKGLRILEDLDLSDPDIETVQFQKPEKGEGYCLLPSSGENQQKESVMAKTVEELEQELAAEKEKTANLEKENGVLLSDKQKNQAAVKADSIARVKKAAEGKIPAGELPALIALADSLPTGEIELKDGEGKVEKISPASLLERFLSGMKPIVGDNPPLEIDLGDRFQGSRSGEPAAIGSLMGCV